MTRTNRFIFISITVITLITVINSIKISDIVRAQEMNSQNYKIQGGNLNMTSGNKESTNFKLADVVGQTAAGLFLSRGYVINAGFQNSAAGDALSFSITPGLIDFGELVPEAPIEKTIRIAISNGNIPGYTVKVSQNQPLTTNAGAQIVDTACNPDHACTPFAANKWSQNTSFGLGYRMAGRTVADDFKNEGFYRPFAATAKGDQPVAIMQSQARKVIDQATMTLRLNTGKFQPVGQYRNVISFLAMGGI